jgi:predicted phage replisome organizer
MKRYYWLKLPANFFELPQVRILEGQSNGSKYLIFLFKILLQSLLSENVGTLRVSEKIPYTDELLAAVTSTDVDIARSALRAFRELGIIEVTDDRTLYVPLVIEMVGTETDSAERMRRHRERKNIIKPAIVGEIPSQCDKGDAHSELEKSREEKKDASHCDAASSSLKDFDAGYKKPWNQFE